MNDIINYIKKIIKKKFKISNKKISLKSELKEDLKLDSLDFVELIMLLEEKFNIELFNIESEKIKNIYDLASCVKSEIKKNKR
ncbi:phosphopantetheine-binding protein [Buchnera aphidicola]|uniref:Acyl carrier protein n=1 Tax=Buchnera aphidicola (Cinara strobi) TaxID=1921549 RepID=A0A3B1E9I3_9GAMM|nr:DUF1493 family protein [Buchnera aphidicola]VAX76599.1 Acyl carrier protein [Buchnera aphidicola (Cinara strobi)]